MSGSKYGKYFTREVVRDGEIAPFLPRVKFNSLKNFGYGNFGLRLSYVTESFEIPEEPHAHDFEQYLCFIGTGSNYREFDAEVELFLGEELEKHIITETTVVHIPKGMIHCPLRFTKVNKPITFINAVLTDRYAQETE
ncbi:MAG: hypothetical protein PVG39_18985 [Desulfobacteraceae bacterium]|jgi:hypothetical protein